RRGVARDTLRRPGRRQRDDRGTTRPGTRNDSRRPTDNRPGAPGRDGNRRPDQDRDRRPDGDRRDEDRRRDGDRDRPDADRRRDDGRRRETEGSKKQPRRDTESRPGRALRRARQTVKSALSRARRAGRRLLGKGRNLGRKLNNSTRRMRDAYKRRRDLLHKQRQRRQEQKRQRQERRDQRRGKENSEGSKQRRIDVIMARITSVLRAPLRKGILKPTFRATLAAMKVWYRLTGLVAEGSPRFQVIGTLNPKGKGPNGEYSGKESTAYSPPRKPAEDQESTDPGEVHRRARAALERMDREGEGDVGKRALLEQIARQAKNAEEADKDDELADLREDERRDLDDLLEAYSSSGYKRSEIDPKKERDEKESERKKKEEEGFRAKVNKATHIPPRSYSGGKHWKGTSEDERRNASRNGGAGQFMKSMGEGEVKQLEREALLDGKRVEKPSVYYGWKRFGRQIGWANGKPAYVLRAEMTKTNPPFIHSHPRLEMD
ncbi:hypothetical protein, partial [Streptomyces sporangiiformans]|uniref:hypothetical protein n=1 Tax=Streptomyces sporangiiformans TaxID=2315329 RepID=UPI0019692F3A